ncbi:hypothetical protein Tco_0599574 [Tanacetum coccineum]
MTVESEEEFEEETEEEIEKEEEDSQEHFDTFPTMKELRILDHDLGSVVFGKPFVEATRLVYDREEGTIAFEKDKEKIMFIMPHKMEMFKHIDFTDVETDHIPPFVIESDYDDSKKSSTLIA